MSKFITFLSVELGLYLFLNVGFLWSASFSVNDILSFQSALNEAASNDENDTITVLSGVYNLSNTLTFYSSENNNLSIFGSGVSSTVLDGGNITQLLNLSTSEPLAHIIIRDMTFRQGKSNENGGGLNVQTIDASITIEKCDFNENFAEMLGGGINALSNKGIVTIVNCSFRHNSAIDDAGGLNVGITDGSIILTNCIFADNEVPGIFPEVPAKDGGGAILYVDGNGQVTMTNNKFEHNRAADGGGGCMLYFLGSGIKLILNNNIFNNNTAQLDGGGCFIRINDNGAIKFKDNIFIDNHTIYAGGAGSMIHLNSGDLNFSGNSYLKNTSGEDGGSAWIWNGTGNLIIFNNEFFDNRAANNGGGAFFSTDQGKMSIRENIFNKNFAGNVGGGLSYSTDHGSLKLSNNTFYGNQASKGGGIYFYFDKSDARTTFLNNILWHDTPNELSISGSTSLTANYSNIENGTGETWFGKGYIDKNPLFSNPSLNDFHLSWKNYPISDSTMSPCIDAGNPVFVPEKDETDFDGESRLIDNHIDIGADEFSNNLNVQELHSKNRNLQVFTLEQNNPNPFNSYTNISFVLLKNQLVTLKVYDVFGNEVSTLVNEEKPTGEYSIMFDAKNLPGGCYFY